MVRINTRQIGWRSLDGCALIVDGRRDRVHRLNPSGSAIWRALAAGPLDLASLCALLPDKRQDAPLVLRVFLDDLARHDLIEHIGASSLPPLPGFTIEPSAFLGAQRPRRRLLNDLTELDREIQPAPDVLSHSIGDGFLVRLTSGALSLQTGPAAVVWRALVAGPRSFVDVLDAVCDHCELAEDDAEGAARCLLAWLRDRGGVRGVPPESRRTAATPADWHTSRAGHAETEPGFYGVRTLGYLTVMRPTRPVVPLRPGIGPVIRDVSGSVTHVAIVCQYGINGFAPGVARYVQRCIERLRMLDAGLIIVAGGGRHGDASAREAESVARWYQDHFPHTALWVENYSTTSWENLKNCLEMLVARSIVPDRVSILGDQSRVDKLRLSCRLARRRFSLFRDVPFTVLSVNRHRTTWRDSRPIQATVGSIQVIRESRAAGDLAVTLPT